MARNRERFRDRRDAGQRLAERLVGYRKSPDTIVLGLPRGGVPVAAEIAAHLDLPLDALVVRKLGVPGHEEVAFGAIASGGIIVLNPDIVETVRLDEQTIERVRAEQASELERRELVYRGSRPPLTILDRTVIIVDDGTATGATMRVAVEALKKAGPSKIVVAVGVAPPDAVRQLKKIADEVVVALTPRRFTSVGTWYDDFTQTTDTEVITALS